MNLTNPIAKFWYGASIVQVLSVKTRPLYSPAYTRQPWSDNFIWSYTRCYYWPTQLFYLQLYAGPQSWRQRDVSTNHTSEFYIIYKIYQAYVTYLTIATVERHVKGLLQQRTQTSLALGIAIFSKYGFVSDVIVYTIGNCRRDLPYSLAYGTATPYFLTGVPRFEYRRV